MMINFNQLRIFYQTAKYQSCTVAAQKLFITQPAVTAQIKAFEDSCNLRLFKKKGRKIYLTDEGKTLFEYAKKVFEYEKEIENAIEDMRELKKGVLRLGTTKTYARAYMPLFISKYRQSYPKIRIYLNEGSSLEMTNSVLDFKNELVIVAKVEENPQIHCVPFCQEEIVVLLPPDHDIAKKKSARNRLNETFAQKGLVPNILMETNNTDFIKQLVHRGDGISFLVKAAVSKELENKELVTIPIEDCQIFTAVNIAYLKNQHLSTPAQAFLDILEDLTSESAPLQSISSLVAGMLIKPL
jgi:DNA-binding transcriptional LysR family regulator